MTPRPLPAPGRVRFRAVVGIRGVNPYVRVSGARARRLRARGRSPMPVRLRLNATDRRPWRTNLMPAGDGSYYLYLHGPARTAAAVGVGDAVLIDLEFDAAYRNGPQHRMPRSMRAALERDPVAARNWSALPPSRKKELLRYLAHLKGADVRERNIAKAVLALSGARLRFVGRAWADGR